jgi:putative nucleotidyltransferase with HDIG domain
MTRRVTPYVILICALAVASGVALYLTSPSVSSESVRALLLLSFLAVVAETLALVVPNSARGSLAFIPYLASAVIAPSWIALVAVATVKALADSVRRVELRAAIFNIAQHALTLSAAIWAFKLFGGESLLRVTNQSFLSASVADGSAALIAFAASFFLNGIIVCYFLALRTDKSFRAVWRQSVVPTIGMDLVAGPVVFIFAWLCAAHGPIAAAALWVPILGLREVHKVNLELQKMNQELLQLMVKSIEARDSYTSGHSRRVQHYSIIIARSLGLSEKEVDQVGRAALLHDVGKIYEKYAPILRKADKLSSDEWATMQEHPIDGANLVSTMSGLKDIVPAIRHHHENWDGTGYPDNLRGAAIPLAARIITFADTIDAMTSERPYRQPLTESQVRAEIIRCRGRQFDPVITDRLIASGFWNALFQPQKRILTPERGLKLLTARRGIRESA